MFAARTMSDWISSYSFWNLLQPQRTTPLKIHTREHCLCWLNNETPLSQIWTFMNQSIGLNLTGYQNQL